MAHTLGVGNEKVQVMMPSAEPGEATSPASEPAMITLTVASIATAEPASEMRKAVNVTEAGSPRYTSTAEELALSV